MGPSYRAVSILEKWSLASRRAGGLTEKEERERAGERGRATMRTEGTERERKRQRESVCVCARLRVSVLGCYAAISKPFVYLVKDKIFKMT